jgi:hypothetical protein
MHFFRNIYVEKTIVIKSYFLEIIIIRLGACYRSSTKSGMLGPTKQIGSLLSLVEEESIVQERMHQ